jgi:hypothetical protein
MAALLPIRWQGHHVDVCAVLEDHHVRWIARDVLEAVTGDAGDFAGDPGHTPAAQHLTAAAYSIDTIRGLLADTDTARDLLRFLVNRENAIAAFGHMNLARYASEPAHYDGPVYAIATAARILGADTSIGIGATALFQWLLDAEWIYRSGDQYKPADLSVTAGRLVVVPRRIPTRRDAYPQVVLTAAGLAELHQLLGGTDPSVLEQEPA